MPSESTTRSASTRKPCANPVKIRVNPNTIAVPTAATTKRRRRHCRSRSAVINIRMCAYLHRSPACPTLDAYVTSRSRGGRRTDVLADLAQGSGGLRHQRRGELEHVHLTRPD